MANAITKYTIKSSFTNRIPHLEGQEVFGSIKRRANIGLGSKGDSHRHDHVNFDRELTQRQVASLAQMLASPLGLSRMSHLF
jgi:hypothetical protein